jgi:epoxide hydrolase-like predicted phosphatase
MTVPDPRTLPLHGLIVDWGGVLTAPLDEAMDAWARAESVPMDDFQAVMAAWLGAPAEIAAEQGGQAPPPPPVLDSPVHQLERGELSAAQFEVALSGALAERGVVVPSDGLLVRMLAGLADLRDDMLGLVRNARRAGIRTALLSNSWGEHYPEHQWAGAFDAVVISGRVGMRKPEPEIFRHTAELIGLDPSDCVMVDDIRRNIEGAAAVGMAGVLHTDFATTEAELDILLGLGARPGHDDAEVPVDEDPS